MPSITGHFDLLTWHGYCHQPPFQPLENMLCVFVLAQPYLSWDCQLQKASNSCCCYWTVGYNYSCQCRPSRCFLREMYFKKDFVELDHHRRRSPTNLCFVFLLWMETSCHLTPLPLRRQPEITKETAWAVSLACNVLSADVLVWYKAT